MATRLAMDLVEDQSATTVVSADIWHATADSARIADAMAILRVNAKPSRDATSAMSSAISLPNATPLPSATTAAVRTTFRVIAKASRAAVPAVARVTSRVIAQTKDKFCFNILF